MRTLILYTLFFSLSITNLFAQPAMNSSYDARWRSVELLMTKGLNTSAEKEVLDILKKARAENNTQEYIRALCMLRVQVQSRDERARWNDILFFEKEIPTSTFPATPILHSLLAGLYWNYYEENRWRLLDQGAVAQDVSESIGENSSANDMPLLSAKDLFIKVKAHYDASLKESKKLQTLSITTLPKLIPPGKNTASLRPTVYDVLLHLALAFYQHEEPEIIQPEFVFELNSDQAFAPAPTFCSFSFQTLDTLSQKYSALKHYQEILRFHLSDTDPAARIDADLARLAFVYEHSTHPDKDTLYRKALEQLVAAYPQRSDAAMASYRIATTFYLSHASTGQRYPMQEAHASSGDEVKAKALFDRIIEQFPKSEAVLESARQVEQLTYPTLSVQTEKAVLPNQPILARIEYKNVTQLFAQVVSVPNALLQQYNYDEVWQQLIKLKAVRSWSVQLPDKKDYRVHSTEIALEGLPIGTYALLLTDQANLAKGILQSYTFIQVSNLAYIIQSNPNASGGAIYVVDRETGSPVNQAEVVLYQQEYDYTSRKTIQRELLRKNTNKDGKVGIPPSNQGYIIQVNQGKDQLRLNDPIYNNAYGNEPTEQLRTFLFTDRAIYRPGQTIYFKGIVVRTKNNPDQHEVVTKRACTFTLFDANWQSVTELQLTTNAYGSVTGQFIAPQGLLTGEYHIQTENGSVSFSVEEYKRPKFEVIVDTLKETFSLRDNITVHGLAKAFAGNAITDAMVKYTVTRKARFPYPWCFWYMPRPSSPDLAITHGQVKTKSDGSFDITFQATPDARIDKKTMPVFDFEVQVDVTDMNGETRSTQQVISVSYQSLVIRLDVPEIVSQREFKSIGLETQNLAGVHQNTKVRFIVKKLVTPTMSYRKRLWDRVEFSSLTKNEFRTKFPLDEFEDENNPFSWATEKVVYDDNVTSSANKKIDWNQSLAPGYYMLEASTKVKGEEVIDKRLIRIIDEKNMKALPHEHLLTSHKKLTQEPGETASWQLAIPFENQRVIMHNNQKQNVNADATWLTVNSKLRADIKVTENDRGGFGVQYAYVRNNRIYEIWIPVTVPFTNKELLITTETFRDKLVPGEDETWRLKITGHKKEQVAAEILATLYDASLDAFRKHSWNKMNLFTERYATTTFSPGTNFTVSYGQTFNKTKQKAIAPYDKVYPRLNNYGLLQDQMVYGFAMDAAEAGTFSRNAVGAPPPGKPQVKFAAPVMKQNEEVVLGKAATDSMALPDENKTEMKENASPSFRTNFNETVFFFPQLETDPNGNIILKFKTPDALTRWKLLTYGHTPDLKEGMLEATTVTQKDIMIVPNTPRFLRQGDAMFYIAKVTNLGKDTYNGKVTLALEDVETHSSVNEVFKNQTPAVSVQLKPNESKEVSWPLVVPTNYSSPVIVKTMVTGTSSAGQTASDGEQHMLPVVPNTLLVTETLPLHVKANTTKHFELSKLLASDKMNIQHHALTVEYTSNPYWFAIQALPYLTTYPYECSEQTFNKYYANTLAAHILKSNPKIQTIFSSWKEKDSASFVSNLMKNEELKSLVLQETPWVLEAKTETDQMRLLADLFNTTRLQRDGNRVLQEVEQLQTTNGGFTWFKGMPDNRYITQYILTGIGRLLHLGVYQQGSEQRINNIVQRAIPYLDARMHEDYLQLQRNKADRNKKQIGYTDIQYLYMRSFFKENYPLAPNHMEAFDFYLSQCGDYALTGNRQMEAMSALALHRWNKKEIAQQIVASLRENAIHSDEMGMYWKELNSSYWWYEAPIESMAMLIECFEEVALSENEVDEMKQWLLKNKQTNRWSTTKATADACYALLLKGTYGLSAEPVTHIQFGNKHIHSEEISTVAGTGYFKTSIPGREVESNQGNITVEVKANSKTMPLVTWGAVYWQYFQDMDEVTASASPLRLTKKLYRKVSSASGDQLQPLRTGEVLHVGDRLMVRLELRSDRSLEFVHLKDMRAACMEPINVLSGYQYRGGLGYYESTKDLATNFFFQEIPKGEFLFEYPLVVTHRGTYSNGIATIQCMYAPEFSSHSSGMQVTVE